MREEHYKEHLEKLEKDQQDLAKTSKQLRIQLEHIKDFKVKKPKQVKLLSDLVPIVEDLNS